jgi:hypothetical protein
MSVEFKSQGFPGWFQDDPSKPTILRGNIDVIRTISGFSNPIVAEFNYADGSIQYYRIQDNTLGFNGARELFLIQSASGAREIVNQAAFNDIKPEDLSRIESSVKSVAFKANQTLATSAEKESLKNSPYYKAQGNTPPPPVLPPPDGSGSGAPNSPPPDGTTPDTVDLEDFGNNPEIPGLEGAYLRENFGTFRYPQRIDDNGQDYLKFDIIKYGTRKVNEFGVGLEKRENGSSIGTIFLPIQPSIQDTNRVDWQEQSINPFDLATQAAGMNLLSGASGVDQALQNLQNAITDPSVSETLKKSLVPLITQMATQSQNNLLSRMSGAVLNPNMELLFQGPTLRPFTFSFRMTPRNREEAVQVRSIIRAFKEAMAVQQGAINLFLKSPYVFKIRYVLGTNKSTHPSLNRIKTCALTSCNVDYTPAQTYMTYNDPAATMTSYAMTLSFTELNPIYAADYKDIPTDRIGF